MDYIDVLLQSSVPSRIDMVSMFRQTLKKLFLKSALFKTSAIELGNDLK